METEGLALTPADIQAGLTGETFGGVFSIAGSDAIRVVAALHVAGAPAEGVFVTDGLTHATLNSVVEQSLAHWTAAGVEAHRLDALRQVDVQIADLPDSLLGVAALNIVWIDRDAAGYGWSVNSGGVDLFSALTHEFGHVLGFRHQDNHDVMGETLAAGVRPVPEAMRLGGQSLDQLSDPSTRFGAIPLLLEDGETDTADPASEIAGRLLERFLAPLRDGQDDGPHSTGSARRAHGTPGVPYTEVLDEALADFDHSRLGDEYPLDEALLDELALALAD